MEHTDAEKLEKINLQNRNRQQRYYEAHKAEILTKKKADRDAIKILNTPVPEVIIPTTFTLEMIQDIFKEHITNENTQRKYLNDIKRVFTLAKLDTFTDSIEIHNLIKTAVENSKYSLSTKKGTIQSILVFLDKSGMVMDKKVKARYSLLYDVAKVKTDDEHADKVKDTNNDVMLYSDYIQLVRDKFGEDSKEYLITMMYNEVPVRDNFGSIKLIENLDEDDNVNNFLQKDGEFIILNDYKTKNKYQKQIYTLSAELAQLLTDYIDRHELNNLLFPENTKKGLSQYVIGYNKKLNLKIGVNVLRKMKITEFLNDKTLTAEQRIDFSRKMCHTEKTQQTYKRGIKKGVIEPLLLEAIKN